MTTPITQFHWRCCPRPVPFLYAPVRNTRTRWSATAATIRCAEILCTARIHQPNVMTYSMSFTDAYARSTDGTYRNKSGSPERINRKNNAAETVPSQKEYVQSSEGL